MTERAKGIIDEFGPLQGIRILVTGQALAGPGAARWMGDMGAEVIKIERPGQGDLSRLGRRHGPYQVVPKWISMGRSSMSIEVELDFKKYPEAETFFIDLVKQCDIWINSVPGIDKKGPTDELALAANPKLVIVQVTGFGLKQNGGLDEYLTRPTFDVIAQAFSGACAMQGMPDGPILPANPMIADNITAMTTAFAALSGYINAQKTGKGQVVDVAMYEALANSFNYYWCTCLNNQGPAFQRTGPINELYQPFGLYECKDKNVMAVAIVGIPLWTKLLAMFGVDIKSYPYNETCCQQDPELAKEFAAIWQNWLAEHSAQEAEEALVQAGVPAVRVLDFNTAEQHPHWVSRNDFVYIDDQTSGEKYKDLAPVPRFTNTPGKVWRGGPLLGQDTDVVLKQILGYSDEKISDLKNKGFIAASNITK
ncbi:MAG: Bile acid-CoA hydrolase [Pelotomaculum sp. PtaB.Bin104]|nr:MAG: Bile acid-CoA hydrolase [Pelotomaculum sp. PtaB.Bin104]